MVNNITITDAGRSHVKMNREYLLRKSVASDLNTYLSFSPFNAFADILYEQDRLKVYKDPDYNPQCGSAGTRSIFSKFGAVLIGGQVEDNENWRPFDASPIRISNNVPLIDSPENRKKIRENGGYTIKELVEASRKGILGRATYSYSDFMYCKYLGQIPNIHWLLIICYSLFQLFLGKSDFQLI